MHIANEKLFAMAPLWRSRRLKQYMRRCKGPWWQSSRDGGSQSAYKSKTETSTPDAGHAFVLAW